MNVMSKSVRDLHVTERSTSNERVRVPKTAELVAAGLRRRIVLGELKEGDALPPETVLMEQFGISRPTLREAFRVLEAESLITIRRGSRGGARIRTPSQEVAAQHAGLLLQLRGATLGDVFRARLVVEPPAAAMLATQKNKRALAGIRKALEDEAAAMEDPVAFGHAAAAFHEQVIELAGNHTLSIFASMLADIIDRHTTQLLREASAAPTQPEQMRRAHRSHEKLVQLIEKGSAAQAEAHWRSHMESLGQWFIDGDGARKLVEFYT